MNSNLPEWSPRQLWFCWYQTLMTDKWISCYFDCFCVGRKWTRHSRWLNRVVSNMLKTVLILFYMKECSFQAHTNSPCSTWHPVHLTLLLLLCVKPICHKNSWEICFSGRSRQTLPMWQTGQFSNILHWFFLELNHFKLVSIIHSLLCFLAALPHLYCIYMYGNLSIYCISGLNCVKQVNAHHHFVLACPIFLWFETFTLRASKCIASFCTCL